MVEEKGRHLGHSWKSVPFKWSTKPDDAIAFLLFTIVQTVSQFVQKLKEKVVNAQWSRVGNVQCIYLKRNGHGMNMFNE